jgi:hypothetical protein
VVDDNISAGHGGLLVARNDQGDHMPANEIINSWWDLCSELPQGPPSDTPKTQQAMKKTHLISQKTKKHFTATKNATGNEASSKKRHNSRETPMKNSAKCLATCRTTSQRAPNPWPSSR